MDEKKVIKGFNWGFQLMRERPDLALKIIEASKESALDISQGFRSGASEFLKNGLELEKDSQQTIETSLVRDWEEKQLDNKSTKIKEVIKNWEERDNIDQQEQDADNGIDI